jgi:NTP pyrophosphatase (non-canonical NTP hydrolase)
VRSLKNEQEVIQLEKTLEQRVSELEREVAELREAARPEQLNEAIRKESAGVLAEVFRNAHKAIFG